MENKFDLDKEAYKGLAYFAVYEMSEDMSNELDHLENFNDYVDAEMFCREYEFNTHIVLMPEDDPEAVAETPDEEDFLAVVRSNCRDFRKHYGYEPYEVVAEFDKGKVAPEWEGHF